MQRRQLLIAGSTLLALKAQAHHGWSSFDQTRPIYLEGKAAKVAWRNPHAEFQLDVDPGLKLPADLKQRALPAQSAHVDGAALLANVQLPTRKDKSWDIELAPLTRLQAWNVPEIRDGDHVAVIGFTFTGEKGDAVVRAEYLFVAGKAYGLRSSPV